MVKKSKSGSPVKKRKPRQKSRKVPYKKEQFDKFLHENRQARVQRQYPAAPPRPSQIPSTKAEKIVMFLKVLPYILGSLLIIMLKYKDVGGVIAKAAGDAYIKNNDFTKDRKFKEQTKFFITRIIDILSSFDKLELLAFSTSLFALFADEIPRIIKNSQNIQGISYSDIYTSIFARLLQLRDAFGEKLGLRYEKVYPLR